MRGKVFPGGDETRDDDWQSRPQDLCDGRFDAAEKAPKQLLHLVFGGELISLDSVEFTGLDKLDVVGIYPSHAEAYSAWRGAAQRTVDNAQMRYFIVHIHRLLDPRTDSASRT